uniref:Uncharacterized protein n=1 Tax=Anguilla anguilla TaxID=7936 RepID=A0A0E9U5U5_ANGAN
MSPDLSDPKVLYFFALIEMQVLSWITASLNSRKLAPHN